MQKILQPSHKDQISRSAERSSGEAWVPRDELWPSSRYTDALGRCTESRLNQVSSKLSTSKLRRRSRSGSAGDCEGWSSESRCQGPCERGKLLLRTLEPPLQDRLGPQSGGRLPKSKRSQSGWLERGMMIGSLRNLLAARGRGSV